LWSAGDASSRAVPAHARGPSHWVCHTRTQRPASEQRPGSPHNLDQFIGGRQLDILCYTRQRWRKILVKQTLDIVCTVYWTFLRNSVANNCFRYFLECGRSEFCSDLGSCCCESTESHMRTRFIFVPFYFTILQNIWYLQSFEMTVGSAIVSKHYLI
jgi:hypothetical protein